MNTILMIIVTFFAGMGAGLGTGFAGMSAAAVISPMLITFLGMDPYMAVGIALSSDVLASAVSAYTYGKNKNLDVKNGLIMMVSVLTFTVVGSYVSSLVPSTTMGNFSWPLPACLWRYSSAFLWASSPPPSNIPFWTTSAPCWPWAAWPCPTSGSG